MRQGLGILEIRGIEAFGDASVAPGRKESALVMAGQRFIVGAVPRQPQSA